MKVLVDTNVVLDVLLARQPFVKHSSEVFALVETSTIEGYLCATTVTTIEYLLSQALSDKNTAASITRLLDIFEVAPVNRAILEQALRSEIEDFEDAVIEQSAKLVDVKFVVTRNLKDFQRSEVTALDPEELLSQIRASRKL